MMKKMIMIMIFLSNFIEKVKDKHIYFISLTFIKSKISWEFLFYIISIIKLF